MHIRKATASDLQTLIALNSFVQQQHAKALPHRFKKPQSEARKFFAKFGFKVCNEIMELELAK